MAISHKTLLFTLLLSSPILLFGEIRPSPLFSEHAVLAKREDVAIWGDAAPGERVEVTVAGAQAAVNANAQGNWRVTLNLADAPFGPHEMRIGAQVIPDVLIGETWLASGQSNVMLNLSQTEGAEEEIAKSSDNLFRFFWIDINPQDKKQPRLTGKWVVANPKTSPRITALGYYFVKALRRELQCPVGLLHASRGATSIISWMSEKNIAQFPELVALEEQNQKSIIGYEERNPGKKVSSVIAFFGSRLYNGMIHPLSPFRLSGVIWYQGEADRGNPALYTRVFPSLIQAWRTHFHNPELPFLFCQLAAHKDKSSNPNDAGWAAIRQAQTSGLALPATGMAVLTDCGEAEDVHPRDKRTPGERLAALALHRVYGRNVPDGGPEPISATVKDGAVYLGFSNLQGGLVAREVPATHILRSAKNKTAPLVRNSPNTQLEGFALCGKDNLWQWAERAEITGDGIMVSSPKVPEPVKVRYNWSSNPSGNLYNQAGFPAAPFQLSVSAR